MVVTLPLADALATLPTHEERQAHANQTAALTGKFPWGLANPADLAQRPDVSAAILLAQRQRYEAGLPPIVDLMSEWRAQGRLTVRDSTGFTITLAWIGAKEWMVCRFGNQPVTGKDVVNGRRDADAALLGFGYALLAGDSIRFSTEQAAQMPKEPV